MAFRRPDPHPRPSWTNPHCDWLVAQFFHALPALETEIRRLNHWRNKIETMLDEKSLNADQRAELTYILDQLAHRKIIFDGAEEHPQVHIRGHDNDSPTLEADEGAGEGERAASG